MFSKNKKGEILVENIIFIILNVIFLTILVLFLVKQGTGVVLLEDAYSKQIALLIDSAKPGTVMKINLEKGLDISTDKGIPFDKILIFDDNYLTVKLSEKSGSEYPFFNDVKVNAYPDEIDGEYTGIYVVTISRRANV